MSEISDDAFLNHKLVQLYQSEQDQYAPVAKQWLDKGDLEQALETINNLIGQSDLIEAFFGDELPVKAYTTLVEPLEQLIHQANALTGIQSDRQRFYHTLNRMDFLKPFWSQQIHELNSEHLNSAMNSMSHGEQHMARFMANLWHHQDRYPFNLVEAIATLDESHSRIIADWIRDPYWP